MVEVAQNQNQMNDNKDQDAFIQAQEGDRLEMGTYRIFIELQDTYRGNFFSSDKDNYFGKDKEYNLYLNMEDNLDNRTRFTVLEPQNQPHYYNILSQAKSGYVIVGEKERAYGRKVTIQWEVKQNTNGQDLFIIKFHHDKIVNGQSYDLQFYFFRIKYYTIQSAVREQGYLYVSNEKDKHNYVIQCSRTDEHLPFNTYFRFERIQ